MRDTYVIKTDNLKTYGSSFTNEHTGFSSGLCKTFSGGYLYNCSDSIIVSMRTNIEKKLSAIDNGYSSIEKWLNSYIEESSNLEISLKNASIKGIKDHETNFLLSKFVDLNTNEVKDCDIVITPDLSKDVDINSSSGNRESSESMYQRLDTLSDEDLLTIRANLGLAEIGVTDKTIDELIKELSEKTGKDYSSSSKEQIVLLCSTNGIDIKREKTREESLKEIIEKIQLDYDSLEDYIEFGQQTNFSAYRTHKKGSMFNYSAVSSLDDYEFKSLCKKLNINANDKDMNYVEMVNALKDKGLKIHTGEKNIDELKQLCSQYGIDITGGKSRTELEELVKEKLELRETSQYFGITPTSDNEKQKYIKYEGQVDYSKYEQLSDEELLKLAKNTDINTKIYTRNGLIKELAERDWNVYRSYGNNQENLEMSAATQEAWAKGYSSIEEQAQASAKKLKTEDELKEEGKKYGRTWEYFCLYSDPEGFYRDYANSNNLDSEKRSDLMVLAAKGVTDKEILDRKILGIDNRKGWDKVVGTVIDFGIAFGEGVSSAAEAIVDGIDFIATTTYNYWANQAFDDDDEDYNKNIKNMEERIAVDYTREGYGTYVYGSDFGQWVAEKSVDHDTVRGLGNLTGDIAFNAVTMSGVGRVASATKIVSMGSKVSMASKVSTVVAKGITVTPTFLTGFGQGLQQGYAAGGSGDEVLIAAGLKGGVNALQFGAAGTVTNATVRLNPFDRIFINAAVDTGLGATAIPTDSAIQTIYAKGYYDNEGEYHEFTDDMTWGDKYSKLFEQNGGVEKVLETMVAAGGVSIGFHAASAIKQKYDQNFNYKNRGKVVEDGIFGADKVEMEGPPSEPIKTKTPVEPKKIVTEEPKKVVNEEPKKVITEEPKKANTSEVKTMTLEEQIAKANYEASKGRFTSIDIKTFDDITLEDLAKLTNPQEMRFRLADGTVHSYKEVLDYQVRKIEVSGKTPTSTKSKKMTVEEKKKFKSNKEFIAEQYRKLGYEESEVSKLTKEITPDNYQRIMKEVYDRRNVYDEKYNSIVKEMKKMGYSEDRINNYCQGMTEKNLDASYTTVMNEAKAFNTKLENYKSMLKELGLKTDSNSYTIRNTNVDNIDSLISVAEKRLNAFRGRCTGIRENLKTMGYEETEITKIMSEITEANVSSRSHEIGIEKANYLTKQKQIEQTLRVLGYGEEDIARAMKEVNVYNVDSYHKTAVEAISNNITNIFNKYSEFDSYGTDQGIFQRMYKYEDRYGNTISEYDYMKLSPQQKAQYNKSATDEYFRLKDILIRKGFSKADASQILRSIDHKGACSYAATANEIYIKYINDPAKFYNDFGFPMINMIDGKLSFNSAELLMDMYIYANSVENGGALFYNNNGRRGINIVDSNGEIFSEKQIYLSTGNGKDSNVINNYLKSKNADIDYSSYDVMNSRSYNSNVYAPSYNINEVKEWAKAIKQSIKDGKLCTIGVQGGKGCPKTITMYSLDGRYPNYSFNDGGHVMFITEVRSEGYVVSSWGTKYIIPYNELADGSLFVLNISEIK